MKVRNIRRLLMVSLVALSTWAVWTAPSEAASCETVKACRATAHYNRSIVMRDQARFRVARGLPARRARVPEAERTCHTVHLCRREVRKVVAARRWQEAAWHGVFTSNTAADAHLVVRWIFAPCGKVAQNEALDIVGWESTWFRFNVNGAGDTGWWQFELPAHPDISYTQATDINWSTLRARRDSKCGRDWSPEWSSVRDHGKNWD